MCQLARVSRASFYRSLVEHHPEEEDMEVRSSIQQIALAHRPRYGYRRIIAELRRRGLLVNRKRVLWLMQADHLLAVQLSAFVGHDGVRPPFGRLSELGQPHSADRDESALVFGFIEKASFDNRSLHLAENRFSRPLVNSPCHDPDLLS